MARRDGRRERSRLHQALTLLACLAVRRPSVSAADPPRCLSPYEHPSGYATPPTEVTITELCHPRCQSFYDVMRSIADTQPECSSMELGGMLMNVLCSDCGKSLWPVVQSGGAPDLGAVLRDAACASLRCSASLEGLLAHLGTCQSFSTPLPVGLGALQAHCSAPEPASRARFAELALRLPDAWRGKSYGGNKAKAHARTRPRAAAESGEGAAPGA